MISRALVTGAAGFIGSHVVRALAVDGVRVRAFVRPGEDLRNLRGLDIEVVSGDVRSPDDLDRALAGVDHVFHLAAAYDLGVAKDIAFNVNLRGTRHVNDLACSIKNLRRYNYVSTCYVAGKRTGQILETDLEHNAGFRNFYEETKYLAETEVEKLKNHLPVTIYRPSVVVGDSQTGETAKYDGIYHLIHYLRMAPSLLRVVNVGNNDVRLNLVPVDFVVDAIATLSQDEAALGKTLAIADAAPLTTAELFDVLAKEMTGRKSEYTPPTKIVEWFLNLSISPAITGLPNYGVPYFFVSQTYDSRIADELMKKHGIICPRFQNYAGNLLDFVDEFPKL